MVVNRKNNSQIKFSVNKDVESQQSWTFMTNHTHVLLCLVTNPEVRLREVALLVGITERMVQKIVAELADAGFLKIVKQGRCNQYHINTKLKLRHPLESHHSIGALLELLQKSK